MDHMTELALYIEKFANGEVALKSVARSDGARAREQEREEVEKSSLRLQIKEVMDKRAHAMAGGGDDEA